MISPWRTGLALGGAVGLWHLAWSAVVAFGAAQMFIDFILRIHFIDLTVRIAPFNMQFAVTLVALTACIGFVAGAVFAGLWNWLHTDRAPVQMRPSATA